MHNRVLSAGAYFHDSAGSPEGGWRSMDSAPRDGTVVELRCTYGVAPWYDLFKWTAENAPIIQDGVTYNFRDDQAPRWKKAQNLQSSVDDGPYLSWRPYNGDAASYTDPTGGAQNDMAYWRGAVAHKYGLPLDHFEGIAAENAARNARGKAAPIVPKRSLWARLFGG